VSGEISEGMEREEDDGETDDGIMMRVVVNGKRGRRTTSQGG
jgi:hypothetical protein